MARAGLDLAEMEAAISTYDPMATVEANHAALETAGGWGVPTMAFEGEPCFGQNRIDTLRFRGVKLVISYSHEGMKKAAAKVLSSTWQRCRVHFMRNALAHLASPKEHWPQLGSTNSLERLDGEIKRRTDVVAISPDEAAIVRLVGALLLEQNDEWATSWARYMSLEKLAQVSDA
jgi:transposase-like protein